MISSEEELKIDLEAQMTECAPPTLETAPEHQCLDVAGGKQSVQQIYTDNPIPLI